MVPSRLVARRAADLLMRHVPALARGDLDVVFTARAPFPVPRVDAGLAASLARPGGNVTALSVPRQGCRLARGVRALDEVGAA